MRDELQPGIDTAAAVGGATPPLFRRVFAAGAAGSDAHRDGLALAAALAPRAERVTAAGRADLIVTGSAPATAPGRAALDPDDRALLEGAACPVALAPRRPAAGEGRDRRRIDVGIDGGRGAGAALGTATRLALARGARLRLVAVAELDFDADGTAREVDPGEVERLARRLAQAAAGLPGIGIETELRAGLAATIIAGLARDADLLVLGSRAAYGQAGRVAIGEVAARILRGAPCPVMLVPAP